MRFRLVYEGELRASQRDAFDKQKDRLAEHKQSIRKHFHPQLRHLWTTNKFLRERREDPGKTTADHRPVSDGRAFWGDENHGKVPLWEAVARKYTEHGYRFVNVLELPLVGLGTKRTLAAVVGIVTGMGGLTQGNLLLARNSRIIEGRPWLPAPGSAVRAPPAEPHRQAAAIARPERGLGAEAHPGRQCAAASALSSGRVLNEGPNLRLCGDRCWHSPAAPQPVDV